ncbi:sigma-70 family RNA polymerase sigma factor [Singulisphaera sp. Ch08]|uniref:Sigma-70 family RNA polymerase sigma factor n=1 Tax=Singulisphaera sp. Ch08 TaxID=3120278 RepID=A0AAU7CL68_9BACT
MKAQDGTLLRSIRTLFGEGTTGGLTDAQLLGRFLSRRDQAAFEALVARHGPMVFDVCRNLLRSPLDAEDAFQATFLILATQARSIRQRDSLGSWLFGVARRVATRAKSEASRRRLHERRTAIDMAASNDGEANRQDISALHEEVNNLPEKYREAIVLCYLEEMTHEAAAQQLRCPVGTVSVRLMRERAAQGSAHSSRLANLRRFARGLREHLAQKEPRGSPRFPGEIHGTGGLRGFREQGVCEHRLGVRRQNGGGGDALLAMESDWTRISMDFRPGCIPPWPRAIPRTCAEPKGITAGPAVLLVRQRTALPLSGWHFNSPDRGPSRQ